MISEFKLLTMLELQDRINSKINPEWRSANYPWHRAVMVEGVELLEHIGWKWWKKQTPDIAQAKIELVDIWHFAMSHLMCQLADNASVVLYTQNADVFLLGGYPLREKIEHLVGRAAAGEFSPSIFAGLMDDLGMTWDELYTTYIAKNVLNTFRQDHGYKDGTYVKTWHGDEDNVVLDNLLQLRPDATPEMLREQLEKIYALVTA